MVVFAAMTMPPTRRRLQLFAAAFFWGMLLLYGWMAPRLFQRMILGYADFSNFYTAGKIVHMGQSGRLYDLELQTAVQSQFSEAARLRNHALAYMRPPFEALVFLPLSYLPYPRAYGAWVIFSMVLVGGTAAYLHSRIPELEEIPRWLYYPACFSFYPIAYGFVLGQDAALLFLLFAAVAVQWLGGRDFRAGCWLGLALIKFQLVLPLLLILVLKRQWRTLAGFSIVGAMLAGVSGWVVGWAGLKDYPAYLWRLNEKGSVAGIYPCVMPSLRGLVQGWTDPLHPMAWLDIVTALLAFGMLVWAAWQWDTKAARTSERYRAGMAVAFLSTMLAGYHEFTYDLSSLTPWVLLGVIGGVGGGLGDTALPRSTRWALVLGAGVLLYPPFFVFLHAKAQLNLVAIPLLLLAWGFSRSALKHPTAPQPA